MNSAAMTRRPNSHTFCFQCTIPRVRRIIRKGNAIVFIEDGGYIQHRTSRRKIDFVEREGVYFIKMKILGGVNPPVVGKEQKGVATKGVHAPVRQ